MATMIDDFNVRNFLREVTEPSTTLARLFSDTTEPAQADGIVTLNETGREMASVIARDLQKPDGSWADNAANIYGKWLGLFEALAKFTAILKEALTQAKKPKPRASGIMTRHLKDNSAASQALGFKPN